MKGWQRKTLLWVFVFFFLILGPFLVLYSMGYRLDFEKRKFSQTGAIFVKAIPREVSIFINDRFKQKTDFFFGSALIENLIPKKYKVRIEKENYFPWEKTLEVEEKKVTEIKNLILFPVNIEKKEIFSNVEDFWFSEDGKKVILKEKENQSWSLKLLSFEKMVKSFLISKEDIAKEDFKILNLNFEQNRVEIDLESEGETKNLFFEINRTPILLLEKEKVPENVFCFKKMNGETYFLENSGFLYKGSGFEKLEKLNQLPLEIKNRNCKIEVLGGTFFIENEGMFYFLNKETNNFEKILEKIKGFKLSPSKNKLAVFSNEIWVFYPDGKRVFLHRFLNPVEILYWINENYLIFQHEGKIKISEIDDRDKINSFELKEINSEKFYFNPSDGKIYFLKEGIFFQTIPLK